MDTHESRERSVSQPHLDFKWPEDVADLWVMARLPTYRGVGHTALGNALRRLTGVSLGCCYVGLIPPHLSALALFFLLLLTGVHHGLGEVCAAVAP